MTTITARTPEIDWSHGFDRHWNGGSATATHAFNALSLLFPQAELFFIEVVGEVAATVDLQTRPVLGEEVKGFIAQEAIHSRQHAHYNAVLRRQGYENAAQTLVARLQEQSKRHFSPLTRLAVVCAYEHYTAALGTIFCAIPGFSNPRSPTWR